MAKTIGQLTQATTLDPGDEFVIEQSGLTKRVAASVVRGGLINSDIDAAAAIAFSKLAALDSANILVGNGSNVATKVAVTGDVTISNAGVTAIGSAKVTPTMLTQPLTLATAKAFNWNGSSSNTVLDFESIPSWVKRITVMFSGVSTSGASPVQVQLGDSGGVENTGYVVGNSTITGTNAVSVAVVNGGFVISGNSAAYTRDGALILSNLVGNTWVGIGSIVNESAGHAGLTQGTKTLSATLDRVRITTVNGTDTFDAGSVNIMYEG
jgi:hypothetical protein